MDRDRELELKFSLFSGSEVPTKKEMVKASQHIERIFPRSALDR